MGPKRKAAGGGSKVSAKKAKQDDEVEVEKPALQKALSALKKAGSFSKKTHKVDNPAMANTASVVDDYDCMLNQTNIGNNNNKFYVIQVLQDGGKFYAWNRWGRVGESGANSLKAFGSKDAAIQDFKKKYQDKTKNKWEDRKKFKAVPGKYTLLEMGDDDDTPKTVVKIVQPTGAVINCAPSKLNAETQYLMKLIFDNDMFKEAMQELKLDLKKIPLGKLSKSQIMKGFECLDELEQAVKNNKTSLYEPLTSKFYTLIPHDFGRQRPPILKTAEEIREKLDMLLVLADIELALSMQQGTGVTKAGEQPRNPLDEKYGLLSCILELVDKKSNEFKVIEKYTTATKGRKVQIKNVWRVSRDGEEARFAPFAKLNNHKLLWHGTNIAVVAAILKTGLRIMPHSGGRVGRGIYFASENGKSAGYVWCSKKEGVMFLNEVSLGKEHHILRDNCSLTRAPGDCNSVVARGRTEPDPKMDTQLKLDGRTITVPQGPPINQPECTGSSFWQSEYLVYNEGQCRIRYLLLMNFD